MKRFIPLFALILLFSLAACGGAAPAAEAPAASSGVDLQSLPADVDVATVYEIQNDPGVYMLDVREQDEYDDYHIPGINLIPMSTIQNRLDEIPTDKEVIVTCRTGNRSSQVTDFLRQSGFDNVHNMPGGIVAWEEAGYPVE